MAEIIGVDGEMASNLRYNTEACGIKFDCLVTNDGERKGECACYR